MIKIMRAYFHGRRVDLMWYERKGIKMKIKGDCGSFPWSMGNIMILNWMWLREFSWGRSVCDIVGKKKHGKNLYLSLYNGKWLKVVWILVFLLDVYST